MTPISSSIAVPNALIVIIDAESKIQVPQWEIGSLVACTDSCVVVACRPDVDGETELTLGRAADVDPGRRPIFEGELATPSRRITVGTVFGDTALETVVPSLRTRIAVWANSAAEPDNIVIGLVGV